MSTTLSPLLNPRQVSAFPSATTSFAACTWPGHCLGSPCEDENGCDNDWICVNKICSPCCNGSPPAAFGSVVSSRISFSTASTAGAQISKTNAIRSTRSRATGIATTATAAPAVATTSGLTTAAAIGIGVGAVVTLAAIVGIALCIWYTRRKKKRTYQATAHSQATLRINTPDSVTEDRKRLFKHENRSAPIELPSPAKPVESAAIELVELEGDLGRSARYSSSSRKPPTKMPESTAQRQRWPRYRFEEYQVAKARGSQGQLVFSPSQDGSTLPAYERSRDHVHQQHDVEEEDRIYVTRDGQNSPYALFRWPDEPRGTKPYPPH